ncbi:MAG: M20/M25/M40 family metallo-hydrolase [Pseudomonadota bacterium]
MRKAIHFGVAWLAAIAATPLCAENPQLQLSAEETAIARAAEANAEDAIGFLETTVNINSGTMNHKGVRAVGDVYGAAFKELGFEIAWIDQAGVNRGGHLVARRKGASKNLLLIGHLDTVFPVDSPVQTFKRDGDTITGPGVNDMKGGNAVVVYALKALDEAGALDGKSITVFFTGDEEKTGKPISVSRKYLIDEAKKADIALNFEGGRKGLAVTSRRGASGWRLTTTGRRRHSSGIFREDVGAGAVFEASRILAAFYDELSGEEYLTFNPGVIVGGTDVNYDPEANDGAAFGKTNVVAQKVVVDGGLRFISEEQKEEARTRMRAIVDRNLPHTDAEITFTDAYPAMSPTAENAALLSVYSSVSEDLGFGPVEANDPARRGAADISFAAPHTPQSMDGLGVTGEGAHTPEESMDAASLKDATLRTAILIHRLLEVD